MIAMYIDLKVYENSRTSLSNMVPIGHLDQLNYILTYLK